MDLDGAGVVITGAASGIGAALARGFAWRGARLVLADLNAGQLAAVAEETGAVAVPGDAASEEGVAHLTKVANSELGDIDLYCANAGIAGALLDDDDQAWQRTFDVNVMAHVRAAKQLLPRWLERGSGRLLCTVSAAGILSMPGAAAYSVTKHGALAFAEWLAYTYAHRGITVQALCPRGVRTPMLDNVFSKAILGRDAIDVEDVVEAVVTALGTGQFLILPHADAYDAYVKRASRTDDWLGSMNRLQQKIEQVIAEQHGA